MESRPIPVRKKSPPTRSPSSHTGEEGKRESVVMDKAIDTSPLTSSRGQDEMLLTESDSPTFTKPCTDGTEVKHRGRNW